MLKLAIKYEEVVHFEVCGVKFEILIEDVGGSYVKLVARAPREVLIYRDKVKKKIESGLSDFVRDEAAF